ncbi:MAG TPA: histidine kinase [Gemmatimonadaceae bacterium]|nr:histidine kinase [Gemmatimonadaceae bacterium]
MDSAADALSPRAVTAPVDSARVVLDRQRDRAERMLNRARLIVLALLGIAALVYAPSLTPALNWVNVGVLVPILAWTLLQGELFYRRPHLPSWIGVANPVADIAAVTAIIGGYAYAQSASLALKSPIFLMYFVILAALPIAASTRKAAAVACMSLACYGGLITFFFASGRLPTVLDPVTASQVGRVSPLDEGAKLLLLAVAGAIATYATNWQERLATSFSRATEEREQLEARLARAQLQSLRLQLHPHFLFNTLNTINALIGTDRHAAERVVSGLSELLRMSLSSASEQEVTLAKELELLAHYIEIQQIRFQDRLTVTFRIAPDVRHALVPNLMLQPLVENAIRHGIAPRAARGNVVVSAARSAERLELSVVDDGVGENPRREHRDGVGLGNTRARLLSLYGADHRFEAASAASGGFAVRIEFPFRTELAMKDVGRHESDREALV